MHQPCRWPLVTARGGKLRIVCAGTSGRQPRTTRAGIGHEKGRKRRLPQIDRRVECGRDNDGHPMPGDSWVRRRKPTKLKVRSTLQLRRNKKKINHGEASKRIVGSSPAATERGVQSLHAFVPFFSYHCPICSCLHPHGASMKLKQTFTEITARTFLR